MPRDDFLRYLIIGFIIIAISGGVAKYFEILEKQAGVPVVNVVKDN